MTSCSPSRAAAGGKQAHGRRQEADVERYCALVAEERDMVERILALAAELRAVTIEQVMANRTLS